MIVMRGGENNMKMIVPPIYLILRNNSCKKTDLRDTCGAFDSGSEINTVFCDVWHSCCHTGSEATQCTRVHEVFVTVEPMDPVLMRRSIRKYLNTPIEQEKVTRLLKAAMAAPSADDERPWHFVVITDRERLDELTKLHPYAHFVASASVAILVCGDESLQKIHGFWVQDCSAATENILIEAVILQLGAVWTGIYPVEGRVQGVRQLMNIPDHIVPFSLVSLGYPAEIREPAEKYDVSRVHYGEWNTLSAHV